MIMRGSRNSALHRAQACLLCGRISCGSFRKGTASLLHTTEQILINASNPKKKNTTEAHTVVYSQVPIQITPLREGR